MMINKFVFTITLLCVSQLAISHPGGHEFVTEKQAIEIASSISEQFIQFDPGLGFGKLDRSWIDIPLKNRRMHRSGDGYYIVSITNKSEDKTLFLLLSVGGEVFDANFTGKFKGIE